MEDEKMYQEASKRLKRKKGFFSHLIAYVCIIGMLYAIMYFEAEGNLLPVIIVGLSWGIGILTHYFKTFGTEHLDILGISPDWEEKELEKEVEKLKRKRALRERIKEEKDQLDDLERLDLKEMEKRPSDDDFLPEH